MILSRIMPTYSLLVFEMMLSMTKNPPDDILEGLYKLKVRESEKPKTVLELYDARGHITKRKDVTIHTTTWTTHHQTPQRSTTQHSTSWRSATDAILPGHREHTGGSRQDTHGAPVLITIRRPWVAQLHEHAHATQVTDTQAVNKGGDQTSCQRSTW